MIKLENNLIFEIFFLAIQLYVLLVFLSKIPPSNEPTMLHVWPTIPVQNPINDDGTLWSSKKIGNMFKEDCSPTHQLLEIYWCLLFNWLLIYTKFINQHKTADPIGARWFMQQIKPIFHTQLFTLLLFNRGFKIFGFKAR